MKILGFSVGKCPTNNQEDKNDEDDEEGNDKKEEEDEENHEEDEGKEEECTETLTATYISVFCSVTKDSNDVDKRRAPSTGCSTLAYSTSTACESLQGSTTTTTLPEEIGDVLCTPKTCGSGLCELSPSKRNEAQKRAPQAIVEPEPGDWYDPVNYGKDDRKNKKLFMRGGKYN